MHPARSLPVIRFFYCAGGGEKTAAPLLIVRAEVFFVNLGIYLSEINDGRHRSPRAFK